MGKSLFLRIRTDVWIALVVVIASLALYRESTAYPEQAGNYPKGLLLMMATLGVAIIIESLIKNKQKPTSDSPPLAWSKRPYVWALSAYLIVAVYALALEPLGFVIPTAAFMIALMTYFGERRWWLLIVLSAAFISLIYCSFIFMLSVPLHMFPLFLQ